MRGVVPYIEKQFHLEGFHLGFVVAVFELGAMTGALGTARVANKLGRKKSMILCAVLLVITSVSAAYSPEDISLAIWRFFQGICVGAASVLSPMYIATFAFTLGPVVWVLISEMFPVKIRGRAISLSSAVLWLSTFTVILVSPYLLEIGAEFNFLLFGLLNIAGFIFCWVYLPETKGIALEHMKEVWDRK